MFGKVRNNEFFEGPRILKSTKFIIKIIVCFSQRHNRNSLQVFSRLLLLLDQATLKLKGFQPTLRIGAEIQKLRDPV